MIYAVIGIPLCLVVLVKVGKIFTRVLKVTASLVRRTVRRVKAAIRKPTATSAAPAPAPAPAPDPQQSPEDDTGSKSSFQPDLGQLVELYEQQDSSFDVPIVAALVLVIVYMLLGAVLYR